MLKLGRNLYGDIKYAIMIDLQIIQVIVFSLLLLNYSVQIVLVYYMFRIRYHELFALDAN